MDQDLLQRIAEGDSNAVARCVRQYGPRIWSLARRFSRTPQDAEDAVQEVFMAIWRSAGKFDSSKAEEATFITMVARRRLIDRMRRASAQPEASDPIPEDWHPGQLGSSAEDSAEVQAITDLLAQFDSPQREIIAMSVYGGYSHSAIADRLEIPLGTVKTHLRRGLDRVRQVLNIAEEVTP
ncbi:MAG: RNA polymerase sigma factor [Xanthomonadales bacterium]|nr:RNA polymerase sigma factor [Xanthomonadales bacterium]